MAVLLTSDDPLKRKIRAVSSRGLSVVEAYQQLARTLRQSLGPEHAALLAEPSRRATEIDWFANVDAVTPPIRLIESGPERLGRGLERLRILVRDIDNHAASLSTSSRQEERIFGQMLSSALELPDEGCVFLVGEQPVMTCWGHVNELGQPAIRPIDSLLRRQPIADKTKRDEDTWIEPTSIPDKKDAQQAEATDPNINRTDPKAPLKTGWQRTQLRNTATPPPWLLWCLLTLALLSCGVELLRGCAIGLPYNLTGWLLNFCPATPNTGRMAAIADEQNKQAEYQEEYDELLRKTALKRQACLLTPPPAPHAESRPVAPDPAPPPHAESKPLAPDTPLVIPPNPTTSFGFLAGCWKSHGPISVFINKQPTGRTVTETMCFDDSGTGKDVIRYNDNSDTCEGALHAHWDHNTLKIDGHGAARCTGKSDSGFEAFKDECHRGDGGEAKCTHTGEDGEPTEIPFTYIGKTP